MGDLIVTTSPNFSFATITSPPAVTAPGAASFALSVSSMNGLGGSVTFTGAVSSTCGIYVDPISAVSLASGGSGSTTMTAHVPAGCPAGSYTIGITGREPHRYSVSHSQPATLAAPAATSDYGAGGSATQSNTPPGHFPVTAPQNISSP